MFLINLNAEIVACIQNIVPQAKSGKYFQIWFSPDLEGRGGGGNGGVLSMRMQVILDSSFARPGSAPIWGGKKGEFRDWTKLLGEIVRYVEPFLTASNAHVPINVKPAQGRRDIGRRFDIFQNSSVKIPSPGQKREVKYN